MERCARKATHDAGVWRLKDGGDYYAVSLKNYTTSTMTPDEIHQLGLDLVTSISAEADKIFKTMGMTKGTVGERMAELGKDIYPNTDAAKEQLIADLNVKAKWIDKQLPAYFGAAAQGSAGDPPRAQGHRGRRAGRLLQLALARRQAPRDLLDQPARHQGAGQVHPLHPDGA
jgi:hypothetical protein